MHYKTSLLRESWEKLFARLMLLCHLERGSDRGEWVEIMSTFTLQACGWASGSLIRKCPLVTRVIIILIESAREKQDFQTQTPGFSWKCQAVCGETESMGQTANEAYNKSSLQTSSNQYRFPVHLYLWISTVHGAVRQTYKTNMYLYTTCKNFSYQKISAL